MFLSSHSQYFYVIGWLVAIATGLAVVYGPYANNKHASDAVNILYSVLFRNVWAVAVSWVIYACHNGYGSMSLNIFLRWYQGKKSQLFQKYQKI